MTANALEFLNHLVFGYKFFTTINSTWVHTCKNFIRDIQLFTFMIHNESFITFGIQDSEVVNA
jgi:hypothetical protein